MDWHLKVPKIIHFYWSMDVLPYLRYKTIESFIHYNPDWKVNLWYPKTKGPIGSWPQEGDQSCYRVTCTDYFPELLKLPIDRYEYDVSEYGFNNNMSEIHKSDFMRYIILASFGGVWSDMDVLYFNPITDLIVNNPKYGNTDTFVCITPYGHSIGFLMAGVDNKFFEKIASLSRTIYNPNSYQGIGVIMLDSYFGTVTKIQRVSSVVNIGMEAVYSYNANTQVEILGNKPPVFTNGSIGCHWYGGHRMWDKFMKETDGGSRNVPDSIIGNLLKNGMDSGR